MSRRRKTSALEDLIELTANFPWWIGVALALVTYAVLHFVAGVEIQASKDLGDYSVFGRQMGKTLASIFQYLLPIIFLLGALTSAVVRYKRNKLVSRVAESTHASALNEMTWQEFEALVSEGFKLQGYAVGERGRKIADGGVDLVLKRGMQKALVQCKQWRAMKVPVETVRELYGVMAAEGADHGFVVTSGAFTADARKFAEGRNIELMDGPRLFAMFDTVRQSVSVSVPDRQDAVPFCPICNGDMVKRTAKKGLNAGHEFWGCGAFPKCRGTRSF